ncbi:MAG: glycosylase, partial [Clostridia bacterium]|nr:glycosylase [Clostridia bacterium]
MLKWLEDAVFYEIYPISFFDSDGDGLGDLNGITAKADYIKSLGVDAVWLNPIYKSPFKDGGYDVSDYMQIDKRFGTMEDFDNLVKAFKERGIKILLDLVVGHTSDKHKWFKKSGCAKKNKYWDYYVWTDSLFQSYPGLIRGLYYRDGGYLPNYYASQPALNFGFENTDEKHPWKMHYKDERLKPLREEIINIMRFYLDKGIDGFRVDMASSVVKDGARFDENNLRNDSEEGLDGVRWWWNEVFSVLRKEYKDKVYLAEWVMPQRSIGMTGFDMDFLTHDTFPFNSLYRYEKGCNLSDSNYYVKGDNYFSP